MLYLYVFFLLLLLIVVTGSFLRSLESSQIPPNANLIIRAWNASSKSKIQETIAPDESGADHEMMCSFKHLNIAS